MISRPLFMSVAESIVMRAPIDQVGCRSACSAVGSARGRQLRDPRLTFEHAAREAGARGPGRLGIGQSDRAHAEALGLAHDAVGIATGGERADLEIRVGVADLDRLPADRAGAAE